MMVAINECSDPGRFSGDVYVMSFESDTGIYKAIAVESKGLCCKNLLRLQNLLENNTLEGV